MPAIRHLLLERIFPQLTYSSMHFKPCFSPTTHIHPGPVTVLVLDESAQWAAGILVLEAVPTPGQLALTIPVSDCETYNYKPIIPNYCKCASFPLARVPKGLSSQHPSTGKNDGGDSGERNGAIDPLWLKYLLFYKISRSRTWPHEHILRVSPRKGTNASKGP